MNGNYVVLVLGILAVAYLVYFTHTILRAREARSTGLAKETTFRIGSNLRKQVADEARAAGELRALGPVALEVDVDRAREALAAAGTLRRGRCLWVDHDPDRVVHERRMVELLEVEVDLARTTNQALQFLVGRRYDLIVTDLTRPVVTGGVDDRAGIKLLKMLAGAPTVPPAIVYADRIDAGDDSPGDEATSAAATTTSTADNEDPAPGADTGDAAHTEDSDDQTDSGDTRDAGADAVPEGVAADPRLDDARAAGARAAVTTPASLLRSVLDILGAG